MVTASGVELPMHDSRLGPGYTRTYQYDPTPGRHTKGGTGITIYFNRGLDVKSRIVQKANA